MLKSTLMAGVGGFVGTVLRFLCNILGGILDAGAFPLGTLMANLFGCLLIGVFYGWTVKRRSFSKNMNLLLITGWCGGFTTFSTFSNEMLSMLSNGEDMAFWLYMLGSIVLGLLMVGIGIACVTAKDVSQSKTLQQ